MPSNTPTPQDPANTQFSVTPVHEAPSFLKFTGSNIHLHLLLNDVEDDFARRNIIDDAVKIAHLKSSCNLEHCLSGHLL